MKNCSMYNDKKDSAKPTLKNASDIMAFHNHEYELLTNQTANTWRLHNKPIALTTSMKTKTVSIYGTPIKTPDSYAILKK